MPVTGTEHKQKVRGWTACLLQAGTGDPRRTQWTAANLATIDFQTMQNHKKVGKFEKSLKVGKKLEALQLFLAGPPKKVLNNSNFQTFQLSNFSKKHRFT